MKIVFHYDDLRRKKGFEEGRDIHRNIMAKESGISQSQLSFIGTGKRQSLSLDALYRLCKYFNCTLNDLVTFEEEEGERDG